MQKQWQNNGGGYIITIEDVFESTIAEIFIEDGEKKIHYFGYGYFSDFANKTPEKPWRFLEYTWHIGLLSDAIEIGITQYEVEFSDAIKQYITDCTEEELLDIYKHYDNGKEPKIIYERDVTMDTPCGMYIIV